MGVYIKIVVILLFMSCSANKNNQCTVHHSNIDVTHELYTHLVSDKHHHYLFGAIEENQLDYRTSEITIERSAVRDEKNWASFSENIPGKCQAVCQTEKYIYLISRQQYQERQDPKYSKHKLYKVSKEDGVVLELYEWDKGNSFIRDVYFDSDEIGYVFFRPSGNPLDYQFLKTNNGGKEWNVVELNRPVNVTHKKDEKLYFLSYKNNLRSDWVYLMDKNNDNLDSIHFDLNITNFAVSENGDYWLLGKDSDRTVLQHYENEKTTDIRAFSEDTEFSPNQLYKYNDLIVVLASEIDKRMLGGFGGTRPVMYLSKDNGLTWSNYPLDEALYLKPVSFYRDERMTAYIGQGKVLTCSFK